MCGSPDPPPPPPDYSAQKAAFQQSQQGQYDAQAAKYNAAATAFNTNLANFGSKVGEGMSKFGNLTIADKDKLEYHHPRGFEDAFSGEPDLPYPSFL